MLVQLASLKESREEKRACFFLREENQFFSSSFSDFMRVSSSWYDTCDQPKKNYNRDESGPFATEKLSLTTRKKAVEVVVPQTSTSLSLPFPPPHP